VAVSNLPTGRQVALCAALAWVLAPVLRLDTTSDGAERRESAEGLLDEAWELIADARDSRDLELRVRDWDELEGDEPEGPASFRVDVLAILDYALRCLRTGDVRWVQSALSRFQDSVYFLQQQAQQTDTDLGQELEPAVVMWIADAAAPTATFEADLAAARSAIDGVVSVAAKRKP